MRRYFPLILLALAVGALFLAGSAELPALEGRSVSAAVGDTGDTRLGQAILPLTREHEGYSGVVSLTDGRDAYATRVALADAAERTLDVQYYIWRNDMSGTLLLEALQRAANRGVRVRLLLDDNNTGADLDRLLCALNAHRNVEVRVFNPFLHRRWRALDFLTDFSRVNRRMHNKSFTVDNQVTIIGGRNVGDEYFGANQGFLFIDLDVVLIGPAVSEVSQDFDRYWASDSSYPLDLVLPPADPSALARLSMTASLIERSPEAREYVDAINRLPFTKALFAHQLPIEWAKAGMLSDDPAKGLGRAARGTLVRYRLEEILGEPASELQLVSPYFVPSDAGIDLLTGFARRGVRISVLTNSLEATDVAAVHAGYIKRRKLLLKAGVSLFELKRASGAPTSPGHGRMGSSAASLHAKTFAADGTRVFVGSLNLDPRSARLNTENGFVIESAVMAAEVNTVFSERVLINAYKVRLTEAGDLQWVENTEDGEVVYDVEPGTSLWRRAVVRFLSWLPIDDLL